MHPNTQLFGNTEINLPVRVNLVTQFALSILESVRTSKTSFNNTPVRRLNQQLSDRVQLSEYTLHIHSCSIYGGHKAG